MLGSIRGDVRFKEPLSFYTSLRLGGPADILIMPQDLDDIRHALQFVHRERLPLTMIGGGNGVLVRDRGIRGVVVKLDGCLRRVEFQGEEAVAGAAVGLSSLIREAAAQELGGLEFLAGIPGTVGGALAMRARSEGGAIEEVVPAVYLVKPDGTLDEVKLRDFGPRSASFDLEPGAIVVGCRLRLRRRTRRDVQADVSRRLKLKKRSEPLVLASALIWQDPPGTSAAALIDKAGVKGKRVNGAEIAVKHGNFIINRGGAGAADVLALMDLTRERVQAVSGITLREMIRVLGE
jgi:UDP-N-acetylmuramate dehydrogenase